MSDDSMGTLHEHIKTILLICGHLATYNEPIPKVGGWAYCFSCDAWMVRVAEVIENLGNAA